MKVKVGYIVEKLDLYSYNTNLQVTSVKSTLATGLLHYSISHAFTAILIATALLYNTERRLSIGFAQCYTTRYRYTIA